MSLIETIGHQYQLNESALASSLNTPRVEFDSESQARLRLFVDWAKARGVRALPAAPATVAMFVKEFLHEPAAIFATLRDIALVHNEANLASPVESTQVRAVLLETLKVEPPRSWSKDERLVFASLPKTAQEIIQRRANLDSKAVRKALSERDNARLELEQLKQKGVE